MSFAKSKRVRVVSAAALVMAAILSLSLFATASGPAAGSGDPSYYFVGYGDRKSVV